MAVGDHQHHHQQQHWTESLSPTRQVSIPLPESSWLPGPFHHSLSLSLVLLKLACFLVTAGADAHRVVPTSRGNGAPLGGAVVAHALSTGATMVDGEAGGELTLAVAAGVDVLVRDPVGWARCVFHQAWGAQGVMMCVIRWHTDMWCVLLQQEYI